MQIQKLNYAIREDRGTLLSARRNVLRVGDPDPSEKAFDTLQDCGRYIGKRGMKMRGNMTEAEIEEHHQKYLSRLKELSIPFKEGIEVKKGQAEPVDSDDKLYDVVEDHVTSDEEPPGQSKKFKEVK